MLQITKAWHIPSGRVKTGTIQEQNLSLAVSQAERAPECQEQSWKREGLSSKKELFLRAGSVFQQLCRRPWGQHVRLGCLQTSSKGSRELLFPLMSPILQHEQRV